MSDQKSFPRGNRRSLVTSLTVNICILIPNSYIISCYTQTTEEVKEDVNQEAEPAPAEAAPTEPTPEAEAEAEPAKEAEPEKEEEPTQEAEPTAEAAPEDAAPEAAETSAQEAEPAKEEEAAGEPKQGEEEEVDIDLTDPEVQEAAKKIQGGFRVSYQETTFTPHP